VSGRRPTLRCSSAVRPKEHDEDVSHQASVCAGANDGDGDAQPARDVTSDPGIEPLLDGLVGQARRDRAELIAWLLDRGFTVDQIRATPTPMMLPANRVMGDDGTYVSMREMSEQTGIELDLLEQLMRAAGLPRIDDPDAAVVPRADAEAAAQAKYMVDIGLDSTEAVAAVKVLTEGLRRAATMMREPAFRLLVKPGTSEIEFAEAAEAATQASVPFSGPLVQGLLLVQYRHMFEADAISAAERAAGSLPGARHVAVTFADLVGFTELGETLPPEQLERLANRLTELAQDIAVSPVWFVKTIGDAVMLVSPDTTRLIEAVLELIDAAAASDLPRLKAGVAAGLAVSRAGDWFGSPVNVAARVTALALPGTVMVTDSARQSSGVADHFDWSQAGAHHLRGVREQVELFRVRRASR
jgi:adenylate cyclase